MTAKRQFCPRGHDTFAGGRDSSYRCIRCKRDAARDARDARKAEEDAARHAEMVAHQEAMAKREAAQRKRILRAGGPAAKELLWHEAFVRSRSGLCQEAQENGHPGACMRPTQDVYCKRHNRITSPVEPEPEPEEGPEPLSELKQPTQFWIIG
jgi:hypothetical protein